MVSRFTFVWCWLALTLTAAAKDVGNVAPDSGVMAVRQAAEDEWKILRSGDELPAAGEFRASPGRPVRWTIAGGTIHLAAESKGRWDAGERRLSLQTGQAFVQLDENAEPLRLTAGDPKLSWSISAGSQVVLQLAESQTLHVLQGQVTLLSDESRQFAAPITLVRAADGTETVSSPENAETWAAPLLRWTKSAQGLGQLIAKDAQDGSPVRLEIARYRTNVVIQPPVALVQIDQSFFNPYGTQREGTFVFNLPPGASVSRFAMFVTPDQLIEGELIDRKDADRIYTSIVRRKRDPAILEQIGDNLFRMRVFPIFARDTKRILLDFTIPLASDRGEYRFELPLLSDLKPIWDFSLRGTIYPPADPRQIKSYTHPKLKFERLDDGRVVFSQSERMVRPPRSFQISYPAPAKPEASVRAYTPGENALQYFLATIPAGDNPAISGTGASGTVAQPEKKEQDDSAGRATVHRATVPLDLLVVMDTSGSQGNLDRSRAAVRTVVNHLQPDDRVQLGCVDLEYRPLTNAWLAPGEALLKEAYQQLQQQVPLGGSDLNRGLEQAIQLLMASGTPRRKLLVYIGDGVETTQWAEPFWKRLADQPPEKQPLVCMMRVSRKQGDDGWMHTAVRSLGGRYFDLDFAPNGIEQLFEWCLAGMPVTRQRVDVEASGVDPADLFVTADWPAGRDLHVLGKRTVSNRVKLKVSVAGQQPKSYDLAIPPASQDDAVFTGRLWAQRKLESKLNEHQREAQANRDQMHGEIVALCQEWSLMSPLTAFLVLETEEDYRRWNINRQLRKRYWSPPDALPFVPLPEGVTLAPAPLASRPQPQSPRTPQAAAWDRNFVTQSLEDAQKSLDSGDIIAAHLHLLRARDRALQFEPEGFQALYRQVSARMEREISLDRLGLARALADRKPPAFWSTSTPFVPLLVHAGLDPDYLQRNPHALKLVKPIDVPRESTLRDFAKALQQQLGVPVIVAEQEIIEDGGAVDVIVDTAGLEHLSAANLIAHALEPLQLDLHVDKHLFHISTSTKCSERMSTELYPVGDLLRTDILPPPARLSNPFLDHDEFARRRIETRLKQPISVQWENKPLRDAIRDIGALAGVPLKLLEEEIVTDGGAVEQQASLDLQDVPAHVVLRELLEPLQLDFLIDRELLAVTTVTRASERMTTRLYSAAGLVDGLTPDPVFNPKGGWPQPGMAGMGGMGGGFGFGMGMGGMGGGFFGGGMGGMMGGQPVATAPAADPGLSEVEPPVTFDEDFPGEETATTTNLGAASIPNYPAYVTGTPGIIPAMMLIQQNTSGEWEQRDGVGGSLSWFPNTLSLIIRQTPRVHDELRDMFRQMRELADRDPAHKFRRPRLKRIGIENAANSYGPLMNLLQQQTEGEWIFEDGVGGLMAPHAAGLALSVRQTYRVHQEIEEFLARLRRARYLAETIPTRETLAGIDDEMFFFDQPMVTDLPRDLVAPVIAADERTAALARLSVRRPSELQQRWRKTPKSGTGSEFTIRRQGGRIEVATTDRLLRVDGLQAAVAYSRLGLVEVDAWGAAVRQLTDGLLPWLPHRDHEELLQLFEVDAVRETDESSLLRLTFRRSRDLRIEAAFSKSTGRPTAWTVRAGDEELYHLEFADKSVVAVNAQGESIEQWDLLADDPAEPIARLDDFGPRLVVSKVSDPRDQLNAVRTGLRAGDRLLALKVLRRLKDKQPDQPLINFLFAWSLELSQRPNIDDLAEQRTSLERVLQSDSVDLVRWFHPTFFPTLGADGLLQLLLELPEEKRGLPLCDLIADLAISARQYDVALAAVTRALKLEPNSPQASPRQLQQIEVLLQLHDAGAAQRIADRLRPTIASTTAQAEIADLFYRFEQPELAAESYRQALAQEGLSPEERSQLLARQALWLTGESRWRTLFDAQELKPDNRRNGDVYLQTILREVANPAHAPFLLELAEKANQPRHRRDLRIHAAEITDDRQLAANLAYELFQERELPRDRLSWLLSRLLDAGRGRDVVPLLELRLRQGDPLDKQLLKYLANAYEQLNRPADARRATTHHLDVDVPESANSPAVNSPPGGGFF